jgi:nuclear pore complex protein Nup188
LALELSTNLANQADLQTKLARVATDCLLSIRKSPDSIEVFQRLNQTRADLALILIQRLVEVKSTVPEMQFLLSKVWETLCQSKLTFESALNSGDASYYRSLLKLLFLGLRIHADNEQPQTSQPNSKASTRLTQSIPIIGTVIEILDRVVGIGLRDLVAFLHDKPAESSPQDLSLITAILQICLRIPGIEFCYGQIVNLFVQSDAARVATTLFSWSDTLSVNGDPVYGELSILFILELSTVAAMAEQLAIEGLIGHISTANITSYLKCGNVGPFSESAGLQRCYSIWVRGILPLLLNLLDAVGASIATEVSLFLSEFPMLLQQSISALKPPPSSRLVANLETKSKYITFSMCAEAHTLSLLFFALNGYKDEGRDIAEVSWDSGIMLENVEAWLGSSVLLQQRISPMGDSEAAMHKKVCSLPPLGT